jgi:hypothetical protein
MHDEIKLLKKVHANVEQIYLGVGEIWQVVVGKWKKLYSST